MTTILIVDDSPTETHIMKTLLEKEGYTTLLADDGEKGVAEAKRAQPDLVLMDVVMPGLNGFQATRFVINGPFEMQGITFFGLCSQ